MGDRILVVDDEPSVGQLLSRLLGQRGHQVVVAASGEAAEELLKSQSFDLMLVDRVLPGGDGLIVMAVARKLQPGCACIMITGHASTESAVEALRLGAADYLEKPFGDNQLVVQKVEHALQHARLQSERNKLLEKLRVFQAELSEKDLQVLKQKSELEMFDKLLDARVQEATNDLHNVIAVMDERLKQGSGLDTVLFHNIQSILEYARSLKFDDATPPNAARVVLGRIVRRLEAHLELIRRGGQKSQGVAATKE